MLNITQVVAQRWMRIFHIGFPFIFNIFPYADHTLTQTCGLRLCDYFVLNFQLGSCLSYTSSFSVPHSGRQGPELTQL